jgi:hypothetical protein
MRTSPAIAVFAFTAIAASSASADDGRLVGIAMTPARDGGVAWSRRSIESLDGTRVVLPGAGQVAAVAVEADGTVFAIRGRSRFGVAGPGAAAVWRDAPGGPDRFIVSPDGKTLLLGSSEGLVYRFALDPSAR